MEDEDRLMPDVDIYPTPAPKQVEPLVCERCPAEQDPKSTIPWLILKLNVPAERPLPGVLCPTCTEGLVHYLLGRGLSDYY